MSGDYPFSSKIVSPAKCNEKPWDLWVSEIGHLSPRPDDECAFASPAEAQGGGVRRGRHLHSYKGSARRRRSGLHRLRRDTMSLHGLFPQMDDLNAAVCHMCGVIVKCSAAHKHLTETHTGAEPLLPPPPPAPAGSTLRSRSRHKKEPLPPPVETLPIRMEKSPAHTATPPLSRIELSQQELLYLEEAAAPGEVQVCVQTGELPVVSIQDPEELPLGDSLTDDIFSIMNSEGIQSADDITNSADWKNIIRDIGNLHDLNFAPTVESLQAGDTYASAAQTDVLPAFALPDVELAALQFESPSMHLPPTLALEPSPAPTLAPALPPPPPAPAPVPPPSKAHSRSKSSKSKFNLREYDPNKHCGVLSGESMKPCTRSLTCKAHAVSLRRLVEGRAKPFDTLLAEHRAARDSAAAPAPTPASAPAPVPPPVPAPEPLDLPPLLVNTTPELGTFPGLEDDHRVNDMYTSLLSTEVPGAAGTAAGAAGGEERGTPELCWYAASPRPLALCTYNASNAGGAITLGRRYATVRTNIKSSLSRSQCKATTNNFYYGHSPLTLSKSVHMNANKSTKAEVRKLIVSYGMGGPDGAGTGGGRAALCELLGGEIRHALNGHVPPPKTKHKPPSLTDIAFSLDPLLADEKC